MNIELSIIPKPNEINDPAYNAPRPLFYYALLGLYLLMTLNIVVQGNIFGGLIGFAFIGFLLMVDEWNNTHLDNVKEKYATGKLYLSDNNELKIFDQVSGKEIMVPINKNTTFFFESYHGEVEGEVLSSGFNYIKSHGTNNCIVFKDEESTRQYYVYLEDKKEKKVFYNFILWCYKNGCKKGAFVNEYTKGQVTFNGNII